MVLERSGAEASKRSEEKDKQKFKERTIDTTDRLVPTLSEELWLREAQAAGAWAADAHGCLRAAACRGPHLRWRAETTLRKKVR
jgi:hypothetical protein